jgi:predicted histidine transporter YuiF (NhaC family)
VVIALVMGVLVGSLIGGMSLGKILKIFSSGLGNGAKISLNYAILDAFAALKMDRRLLSDAMTPGYGDLPLDPFPMTSKRCHPLPLLQ